MILNELRKNARVSLLEVAKKTDIPLSTIYDKVDHYEKDLIKKYTSLLDFSNIGYLSRVLVALKVKKEARQGIEDFLKKHPNVNSLYKVNSGYDYLAEIISKNSKETQDIVEEIESRGGVIAQNCFEIIDEVKKEAFEIK